MKKYLITAISALAISGCAIPDIFNEKGMSGSSSYSPVEDGNMIGTTHKAADNLMKQAAYLQNDLRPILTTSVANIRDLNASSAFGLMVSEQIGGRFAQLGFPIVDVRARKDLKIQEKTGEFMLSRDIVKISKDHAAGAVLMGTYTPGKKRVQVNVRLVRASDNRVLSAYSFELPMGPDTKKMLKDKTPY